MTSSLAPSGKSCALLRLVVGLWIMRLCLAAIPAFSGADAAAPVQLEFFWAKDCPHCEAVKDLIQMFQKNYHIKVKDVDVDTQKGYKEFVRVGQRFARIPLPCRSL
jgi:thiol-disulfide isomerase/thioredoxin